MKIIYKHILELEQEQIIELPIGYEILSVQNQNDKITLWVMIDKEIKDKSPVSFKIFGTGLSFDLLYHKYLSTVQVDGLVWHVFIND